MKKPIYKILYAQVIFAIVVGIILGHFFPSQEVIVDGVKTNIPGLGEMMKPLGDGFIRLIKMVIAPIIFCTVVSGIAGMQDMKSVGKTGGYALLYFEVVSTIALIVGLVIINVFQPGAGMNIDIASLDASSIAKYAVAAESQGVIATLLGIIPNSVVGAFADGNILQVLLFAILFAFALHRLGSYGRPMLKFIDQVAQVFFNIIGFIMHLAPIGAFGAMAFTIGKYGLGTLWQLGSLMLCFYATCLLFVFGALGAIAKFHGFNIFRVLAYIKEELLIVLGTSSSESVLPRMMKKMEDVGCEKSVVGLVIPTGYSFNLDGTSIYLTMAAIFLAQATNTSMTIWQQLALLAVLFISSKGAAGVTGSGFIVLAATLSAVGSIPVASIAIILGIDRFMSEARALTNLCGNAVATIVVAKWCNQLDEERLDQVLSKKSMSTQSRNVPF